MRTGLASSGGMAGAAPRRPAHRQRLRSTAGERIIAIKQRLKAAHGSSPCLCPCVSGLSSILRAAGLLRPVSICIAVGSGRSPLPLFTALRGRKQSKDLEQDQQITKKFFSINLKSCDEPAPL